MKNINANANFSLLVITVGIVAGILSAALLAQAATTIGTNISTGGTLSVTATTTTGNLTVSGISSFGPSESELVSNLQGDTLPSFLFTSLGTSSSASNYSVVGIEDDATNNNPSVALSPAIACGSTQECAGITVNDIVLGSSKSYGYYVIPEAHGASATGILASFWAGAPMVDGGAAPSTVYQYYSDDIAGSSANPYYSWFNSQGVRRVKEDSTFNGVGQAIEALYNPLFTQYTPGATNYERVILGEWNSNVAEIGTENSGTGSARALALITAGAQRLTIGPTGSVGIGTTSPVANFQVANGSNATTTAEFGSSGQNKGSCLKLYRTDGSAIYAYVAAGATTFTLSTTACASVSNF